MDTTDVEADMVTDLFNAHNDRLVGYCFSIVKNITVAEDIAQDTWAAFLEAHPQSALIDNPAAMLGTIARNKCINYLSRLGKRPDKYEYPEGIGI